MRFRFSTCAAILVALSGCAPPAPPRITAAGSTALVPLVKQAAVEYRRTHPGFSIEVAGGGSRAGLALVSGKAVDLGDSDVAAWGDPSLVDHRIAVGEHIYTNGQPSAQIADFINFIKTDTALLKQLHFEPAGRQM